jgi:protein-disulfide isomerase
MQEQSNTKLVLGIVGLSLLLFVGLVYAVMKAPSAPGVLSTKQEESVSFSADPQSPATGKMDSPVVVRMYSDFQCPACRAVEPAVQYAIEKYKDRVKFIWKDFPLETIHPRARIGADAARCAEAQGKFWEYHDTLYANQDQWSSQSSPQATLVGYAQSLGLDKDKFQTCLSTKAQDGAVAAGIAEGFANRVDRTPTVFINKKRYFSLSNAEWDQLLTAALQETATTTTK